MKYAYKYLLDQWSIGYWEFILANEITDPPLDDILLHNSHDYYYNANWFWRKVSMNPNITWEMIQDHPELPWEISCYAENPNLDLFWVEKLYHSPEGIRKYQWYLSDIVTNDMEKGRDKWIRLQAIRIIKTYQIQRYWRKYSSDPTYALARRSIGNCLKSEEKA